MRITDSRESNDLAGTVCTFLIQSPDGCNGTTVFK
jgi:hypothetical protein